MSDNPETTLKVNVVLDTSQLGQIVSGLQGVQNATDKVSNSFGGLVRAGRELSTVGREIQSVGKSILTPLTQAADEYAKTYGKLEANSRAFLAAQQDQKNATMDLGRVAAQALTPLMEQSAQFTEKIAQFAAAHPELVSTAVNAASAAVAVGGGLVAAGMAISSIAKAADLLKTAFAGEGLAGAIATTVVSVVALGAGALAAVGIINDVGKAIGDVRLATYNLGDALTTARQLVGGALIGLVEAFDKAKQSAGNLELVLEGVGTLLQNKFNDMTDRIATSFRELPDRFELLLNDWRDKFTDFINGLISWVNQNLHQNIALMGHVAYRSGSVTPQQDIANQELGLSARQTGRDVASQLQAAGLVFQSNNIQSQYQSSLGSLPGLATSVAQFAQTGSLGSGADSIVNQIKAAIAPFINGSTVSTSGGVNGSGLPPAAVNAFIAYQKQITDSNTQEAQQEAQIEQTKNANLLKAQQTYADQVQQLQDQITQTEAQQQTARAQAIVKFDANEIALAIQQQNAKLAAAKASQEKLDDLAASRDVAGFVAEQRSAKDAADATDIKNEQDKQARQVAFDDQQKQQDANDQVAIDKLKEQGTKLKQNYDKQTADIKQASADQLTALQQKHADELKRYETAFADQLAQAGVHLGNLDTIYNNYYANAEQATQTFVNTNLATLQKLLSAQYNIPSPTSSPSTTATTPTPTTITPTQATTTPTLTVTPSGQIGDTFISGGKQIYQFAEGSAIGGAPGGASWLHPGEIVLDNSASNLFRAMAELIQNSRGQGNTTIAIDMSNPQFGTIATPADVQDMGDKVMEAVRQGIATRQGYQQ